MDNAKNIAILGLGWLGLPLAQHLHAEGHRVAGAVHSLEKLRQLGPEPFCTFRISVSATNILGDWGAFMFKASVLIICLPPPAKASGATLLYPELIRQITAHTPKSTKVVFTSTTGVYANNGGTVNETTPPNPDKPSGKAVKAAEEVLKAHFGANATILRLGGLIGQGRHPGTFLASHRPLRNALSPLNVVHRSDCIGVVAQVIAQECWGQTINVCASRHPIRQDYYTKAAKALALPKPVFGSASPTHKVVDNSYSKQLLGYEYAYDNPEEILFDKHPGRVSIVGAGPGDYQLLTVKAHNRIKTADIILYDNLVSEEILAINPDAEHCYVGRKFADKSCQKARQEKINELLHFHCRQGKQVVRLKSGDPYIYGRAAEEARYLAAHGVPFEVVPGISAALAAANLNNIPVTERHRSNALMICTAHTANYSYEQLNGVAALLKAGNTLAIYMGLKSLDKLIPKLVEVCQDDSIPVNAVSNVSRDSEKLICSTLKNIRQDVASAQLPMPVVFLIGANPITPAI